MSDPAFTRRGALTALGVTGAAAISTTAAVAATAPVGRQASLERASEALRLAMVSGDRAALDALLHDQLDYMHSSGHSQTKADLMRDLAGKTFFASLTYPEQSFHVAGDAGVVKVTADQNKNLPGGKTRASRIKVLQSWTYQGGAWKLLTRASALIESPLMRPGCPPAKPPVGG